MSEPTLPTRSTSEPTSLSGPTSLSDLSTQELGAATAAITGGDDEVSRLAGDIRRLVDGVNGESRKALGTAARLHADDVSNPAGVARQLAELPANLTARTQEQLDQAELSLDIVEGIHLARILKHNPRDDGNLRAELGNYAAGMKPENAVAAMVALAADPRYSTFLAGPMGNSLAARFNFEPEILRRVALEALATPGVGTEDQVARSRALAAIKDMRRVIGLSRGGRDSVAQAVQRPPRPAPSQALM